MTSMGKTLPMRNPRLRSRPSLSKDENGDEDTLRGRGWGWEIILCPYPAPLPSLILATVK
ncbi:hypothetical protein L484_024499 [Morus notabilis]|uniref:Uncharacterized protein n=1 Tax=Morus notabilis TaxID=981085 RepID=W9RHJ7_9ROSA|nr:hypothetical protein L484_024499 [Morus notabilis]